MDDASADSAVTVQSASSRKLLKCAGITFRDVSPEYRNNPMRLIPNEILSEILIFAWNLSSSKALYNGRFHLPHQTMLVCKHWEEVVMETAALWSHFTLFVDAEGISIAKVSARLTRTKSCPIDVYMSAFADQYFVDLSKALLLLFAPHRSRLWRVQLSGLPYNTLGLLLGHPDNYEPPSPSLRPVVGNAEIPSVRVLFLEEDHNKSGAPPISFYSPFLRTLICYPPLPNIIYKSPNQGILVKLEITDYSWGEGAILRFKSILEHNPRLQILSLSGIWVTIAGPVVGRRVPLPDLSFLRLCGVKRIPLPGLPIIQILLMSFDAPYLEDLVLERMQEPHIFDLYNSVKRVSLDRLGVEDPPICLPSLTHLSFVDQWWGNDLTALTDFLHPGSSGSSRYPQLHTLASQFLSLPSIVELLSACHSDIKTVQICSNVLGWCESDTRVTKRGFGRNPYTLKEHHRNIRWLRNNFCVEIWGKPLADVFCRLPSNKPEMRLWELSIKVLCEGLNWVDEKDLWLGNVPLGPDEWQHT